MTHVLQVQHHAGRLHHRVFLVVLNQLRQAVELMAAAQVKMAVLPQKPSVDLSTGKTHPLSDHHVTDVLLVDSNAEHEVAGMTLTFAHQKRVVFALFEQELLCFAAGNVAVEPSESH